MTPTTRTAISILIIALVTILCRFLPFIVFRSNKKTPNFIAYLGKALPYAIMGMLVVYCLRSVDFAGRSESTSLFTSHGIPELVSIFVIMLIHRLKKNSILSILSGTVCYVLMVNFL
ncbi:MAG: AzlD domain-containing protein [Treponemataceae bacterium]|nr:AzlD domain-containing protein [Treponemataceae bacterium]